MSFREDAPVEESFIAVTLPFSALVEAAVHASTHPVYRERYQRTKQRLGRQRGARVAQVDLARRLAEAIWHMLTATNRSLRQARRTPWPPDGP